MKARSNSQRRLIGWSAISRHLSISHQHLRRLVEVQENRVLVEIVKRDPITNRPCAFVRDLDAVLDGMEGWK